MFRSPILWSVLFAFLALSPAAGAQYEDPEEGSRPSDAWEGQVSTDGKWVFQDGRWTARNIESNRRTSSGGAELTQRTTRENGTVSDDGSLVVIDGRWIDRRTIEAQTWETDGYWTVMDGNWLIVPKGGEMPKPRSRDQKEEAVLQSRVPLRLQTESPPSGLLQALTGRTIPRKTEETQEEDPQEEEQQQP